jgi:hypothetical protein
MWQDTKTSANNPDNYFIAGGVIHAELVQTDGHWKISQVSNDVVWRTPWREKSARLDA